MTVPRSMRQRDFRGPIRNDRFVWGATREQLHAILEEQIATTQEAFCDASPPGAGTSVWTRADRNELAQLPKCPICVEVTRGAVDDTLAGIRWMETKTKDDEEDEGEETDG